MPYITFGVFQNGDNPVSRDGLSRGAKIIVYSSKDIDIYRSTERRGKKKKIKTKPKLVASQCHNYFHKILVLVITCIIS